MLSNAYFLAKVRFDRAENEPAKNLQNFRKCIFEKCIFEKCIFKKCIFEKCIFKKNKSSKLHAIPRPTRPVAYSFLDILSPGDALVRARERPPGAQDAYGLRGAFALRGVDDRAQELRVLVEELLRNRHQQPSGISI